MPSTFLQVLPTYIGEILKLLSAVELGSLRKHNRTSRCLEAKLLLHNCRHEEPLLLGTMPSKLPSQSSAAPPELGGSASVSMHPGHLPFAAVLDAREHATAAAIEPAHVPAGTDCGSSPKRLDGKEGGSNRRATRKSEAGTDFDRTPCSSLLLAEMASLPVPVTEGLSGGPAPADVPALPEPVITPVSDTQDSSAGMICAQDGKGQSRPALQLYLQDSALQFPQAPCPTQPDGVVKGYEAQVKEEAAAGMEGSDLSAGTKCETNPRQGSFEILKNSVSPRASAAPTPSPSMVQAEPMTANSPVLAITDEYDSSPTIPTSSAVAAIATSTAPPVQPAQPASPENGSFAPDPATIPAAGLESTLRQTILPASARSTDAVAGKSHANPRAAAAVPGTKRYSTHAAPAAGPVDDASVNQDADGDTAKVALQSSDFPSPALVPALQGHAGSTSSSVSQPPSMAQAQSTLSPATTGKPHEEHVPGAADTSPATTAPYPNTPAIPNMRILERMGQSEMHMGVKTTDFGTIEVHTSLNQDRVGASIVSSHADLRSAMEAEMPSLQQAIARHQLRLDNLSLAAHAGGQGSGGSGDSQPRSFASRQAARVSPSGKLADAAVPATQAAANPYRLSVIA